MALDALTGETLWTYEEPVAGRLPMGFMRDPKTLMVVSTVWVKHECRRQTFFKTCKLLQANESIGMHHNDHNALDF